MHGARPQPDRITFTAAGETLSLGHASGASYVACSKSALACLHNDSARCLIKPLKFWYRMKGGFPAQHSNRSGVASAHWKKSPS